MSVDKKMHFPELNSSTNESIIVEESREQVSWGFIHDENFHHDIEENKKLQEWLLIIKNEDSALQDFLIEWYNNQENIELICELTKKILIKPPKSATITEKILNKYHWLENRPKTILKGQLDKEQIDTLNILLRGINKS